MPGEDTHIDEAALRQDGDDEGGASDGEGEELALDRESVTSSPSIDDNGGCAPLVRETETASTTSGAIAGHRMKDPAFNANEESTEDEKASGGLSGEDHEHSARLQPVPSTLQAPQTMNDESAWDLFEPERDFGASSLSHSVDGPVQQTAPAPESQWPLPSFASDADKLAWETSYAPSLSPHGAGESKWEDLSDDSSGVEGGESVAAVSFFSFMPPL